jgi:antitoxin MazE
MVAKIQKWGNSQGIRFPQEILRQMCISVGDEVDIEVHDGEIILKPVNRTRGKYHLRDLLSKKPQKQHELDWGVTSGKEIW